MLDPGFSLTHSGGALKCSAPVVFVDDWGAACFRPGVAPVTAQSQQDRIITRVKPMTKFLIFMDWYLTESY
jgi:hypothetical protein